MNHILALESLFKPLSDAKITIRDIELTPLSKEIEFLGLTLFSSNHYQFFDLQASLEVLVICFAYNVEFFF